MKHKKMLLGLVLTLAMLAALAVTAYAASVTVKYRVYVYSDEITFRQYDYSQSTTPSITNLTISATSGLGSGSALYHMKYADGAVAYCIEPGVHSDDSGTYKEGSSASWYNLPASVQSGIALAMSLGYPSADYGAASGVRNSSAIINAEKWAATQAIELKRNAAGSYRFHMTYKTVPHRGTVYSGTIGGLLGGHSGNDIAKGRANAISLLGEFLEKLTGCENAWLIDADVQESQGIPDQATVRLCVENGEAEKQLRQLADMLQKSWRSAYRAAGEDNIALRLEQVEEEALVHDCISCEDLRKIGALLQGIPYGVIEYGGKNQSIPFCTGCTSRFCVKENVCQLWFSVRSLSEALKWDTEKSVKELASQLGADVEILDQYPGWPYRTDSPMQELCKKLFQEMYGEEIKIEYGQGGCEPGIIIDKLPDMDALGLAPTSRGAHTTRERFYIETVEPTYQLFVRMLRQIAENGI